MVIFSALLLIVIWGVIVATGHVVGGYIHVLLALGFVLLLVGTITRRRNRYDSSYEH